LRDFAGQQLRLAEREGKLGRLFGRVSAEANLPSGKLSAAAGTNRTAGFEARLDAKQRNNVELAEREGFEPSIQV
jgi:hypothetical protein